MDTSASARAQQRFNRQLAYLLAATFPVLAIMEITGSAPVSALAPYRWAGYLVLTAWALYLALTDKRSPVTLLIGALWLISVVSVVDAALDPDISALTFPTYFGLVMLLGVLAGGLAGGDRLVWALTIAAAVAGWSTAMGVLLNQPWPVLTARAIVVTMGMVFIARLMDRLLNKLSRAIRHLDRSIRLHEALARCSNALLVSTSDDALQQAVEALIKATDADYAYVDRTIDLEEGPGWEIIAEVDRVTAFKGGDWKAGSYKDIPWVYSGLASGKARMVYTDELAGEEREIYEEDGILSEVSVPILVSGGFRGSVGFVEYTHRREWTQVEVETLWRAAQMIGAYWKREEDTAELRASNESKDRLISSVSHEIRTPLAAIVGLSEELITPNPSLAERERDELNAIIATQSRELAELVEDLLVASRADSGQVSIRLEDVDLRQQVDQVIRTIKDSQSTDKTLEARGAEVTAWADPLRVRQILRNLVTNAIRYGGHQIVVTVDENHDRTRVTVWDDGPGMPSEEAELIFERYYRSAQSPTLPGSLGIGLSVSRQLAQLMNGTLEYVPSGPDSAFRLTLPKPAHRRGVSPPETGQRETVSALGTEN